MTDKQKKQREEALQKSGGVCAICGKSLYNTHGQFAHAIGNTVVNRKKYGTFFIDSAFNGAYVCSLECNKKVDVGKTPEKIFAKLAEILTLEIKDRMGDNI